MTEISLTTTSAARHLLDTISRAEALGWSWFDGMRHVEAEHPISGDLMQAQAWLALAMERPLLCACHHEHSSGSDGEDAGCPCADGHDWTSPVLRVETPA